MAEIDGQIKPEVRRLWERYYPDYSWRAFEHKVNTYLRSESKVLEIGAGSGGGEQRAFRLRGKVAKYVGIDLDERVLSNPHLDESYIADATSLPFQDAGFDVVFNTMVVEHLEHPQKVFSEVMRVLKPGGVFLFETPSRWYYPMILSSILPHRLHVTLIKRAELGRNAEDVFPTFYRCNDHIAIKKWASQSGLKAEIEYRSIPPGYLRFHPATFMLGVLYQRTVEALIPPLRGRIWCACHKA